MSTETVKTKAKPGDCTACRIVGAVGLMGIGAYLANISWKNKTLAGRVVISTLSLTFVSLSIARFRQKFPFEKKEENFMKS